MIVMWLSFIIPPTIQSNTLLQSKFSTLNVFYLINSHFTNVYRNVMFTLPSNDWLVNTLMVQFNWQIEQLFKTLVTKCNLFTRNLWFHSSNKYYWIGLNNNVWIMHITISPSIRMLLRTSVEILQITIAKCTSTKTK